MSSGARRGPRRDQGRAIGAAAAVNDARTNAAQAEARCAAQVKELQADRDLREAAMTRDAMAAPAPARDADDARAAAARKDRRSRAPGGASAAEAQVRRSRRRARRGPRSGSATRAPPARGVQIEAGGRPSWNRAPDRPRPSRRQLRAAPRLAELRALALGLLSDESTEEGASSSAGGGADASSASSLGSGES